MSRKKSRKLLLLFAAFALIAASCGSSDDDDDAQSGDDDSGAEHDGNDDDSGAEHDGDDDDGVKALPGEGVSITPGRADWTTGYFQNEVIAELMRELGYEVSNPSERELNANNGFLAMAEGDIDYWANSWIPGHQQFWNAELSDGSIIADNISIVGELLLGGSIQGLLIEKSFADEFGITSMDDFDSNPAAIAAYDAVDPIPGNGLADIYGCQESWVCDDIIASQIVFSGWENIGQTIAGYEAMFAEAIDKASTQTPFIIYTWGPSAFLTQLRPGDNVYWLTQENVLDDSNPLGREAAVPDMRPGRIGLGPDVCPGAANDSEGLCQIAFLSNDIQVTANNDFLDENPAARALLDAIVLPVFDVSLANVSQTDGESPNDLAVQWIADNRDMVDTWLDAARAAAA